MEEKEELLYARLLIHLGTKHDNLKFEDIFSLTETVFSLIKDAEKNMKDGKK